MRALRHRVRSSLPAAFVVALWSSGAAAHELTTASAPVASESSESTQPEAIDEAPSEPKIVSYRGPLALAYGAPLVLIGGDLALTGPAPELGWGVIATGGLGMLVAPAVVHGIHGNSPGAVRSVLATAAFATGGFLAGARIGQSLDDCDEETCWNGTIWGAIIGTSAGLVLWGTIDTLVLAQVEVQEPKVINRRPPRHGKPITWQPSINPVLTTATNHHRSGVGGLTVGIQGQF